MPKSSLSISTRGEKQVLDVTAAGAALVWFGTMVALTLSDYYPRSWYPSPPGL